MNVSDPHPSRPHSRRPQPPLPIRDGLNPSRAQVPPAAAGMTAFDFVWELKRTQRRRHPADTEAALRASFRRGEVRAGMWPKDRELAAETPLRANQEVWFYRIPAPEVPVPYRCETIFEDERLLVVDKPPFLATMPRGKHIIQSATVQLRKLTGNGELSPAHRLDRLTSGVLVFTKTREVRGAYQQLFARREAEKTYEAIARYDLANPMTQPGMVWRDRMAKNPGELQGYFVPGEPNAITTVISVEPVPPERMRALRATHGSELPQQARYVLQPATGRTHQLRLHMWKAGVPILGDPAYPTVLPEAEEDFAVPMHLRAKMLRFTDPLSGVEREFRSLSIY